MKSQKEEVDAKASADAAAAKAGKDLPDNAASLSKVKDLVCLLPSAVAGEFGQCLALLESLLEKAKTASMAATQMVPDSDSEMAEDAYAEPHWNADGGLRDGNPRYGQVPLFPGGEERMHTQDECRNATGVPTDPYMTGARTPPRGRTKSADPGRSPHTRSRTPERELSSQAASSGGAPAPTQTNGDGGIGFFLAENVAAPFHS